MQVVGIIAINWLIIADQSSDGIFDRDCIMLANLHSNAVDYPKSGQPVPVKKIPKLHRRSKPDWNAPETVNITSNLYYPSQRAIGRLFRLIDLPVEQQPNLSRRRRREKRLRGVEELQERFSHFDLDDARDNDLFILVQERVQEFISTDREQDENQIAYIAQLFQRYASELQAYCMTTFTHGRDAQISEPEAIIGTIAQKSSQPRKRKEAMSKLRESTDLLVRGIREELAGDDSVKPDESLERAWMAWEFSISQGTAFGARSFGWVALGAIFEAIKEIEDA
jgi:RNA-dependent RNA polymerase